MEAVLTSHTGKARGEPLLTWSHQTLVHPRQLIPRQSLVPAPCWAVGRWSRGPSWLPVMMTTSVTVAALPTPNVYWAHSMGWAWVGCSLAFSLTRTLHQRGGFSMGRRKLPQRSSWSFQESTWLAVAAPGLEDHVGGLPDFRAMQACLMLWSGWGREPTPRLLPWARHRSLSSQGTWPSGEGSCGPGEQGLQGRDVEGLHFWASWLGDLYSVSGRCGASAECGLSHVSTGGGGDRPWWPGQSENKSQLLKFCVLVLIHVHRGKALTWHLFVLILPIQLTLEQRGD